MHRRAALLAVSVALSRAASSVVSNVDPRRDAASGEILDIHDGNTLRIGDTFFWYGAGYGGCTEQASGCASTKVGACGFQVTHVVNLATSTDLMHWTMVGPVLVPADRPAGILFSPWVARSKFTGLFVLWFNLLPASGAGFDAAFYAVATSASPTGPFKTAVANVSGIAFTQLPDAPTVFVDDDGAGYLAFTHENTHVNHVQALSPDLLGPLTPHGNVSAQIGAPNNEGILMFKREGRYFVMFGLCCCFCDGGATTTAYSATSPLGPYTPAGTIFSAADWRAQTGSVWFTGVDYVLFGDRWQSAPDRIKGHDFSYMAPVEWNADSTVKQLRWQDNVTIYY